MTHGTDRDTPTDGAADGDAVDAPDGAQGDVVRDGVPQQHDAPDDGPAGAPRQAGASSTPAASGGPTAGPTADGAPSVASSRPLAPVAAEPLAAWPSWDDVAVTAPARPGPDGPRDDDDTDAAARQDGPTPDQAGTPVTGEGPDAPVADDGPDAPDADRGTDEPVADGGPDGPVVDGGPDAPDADRGTDEPVADDASAAPGSDGGPEAVSPARPSGDAEVAPSALPPLSVGGLSALAFTALNAASVGVPAHALPQSPLPPPDAQVDGPRAGEPDAAQPETAKTDTAEPDTAEPDAAEPDAAEPDMAEPDAAEPDAAEPDAAEPDAAEPDAAEPDAAEPDTAEPDAAEPDAADSGTAAASGAPADATAVIAPVGVPTPPAASRVDETAVVPAARTGAAPHDAGTRAVPAGDPDGSWPRSGARAEASRDVPAGPVGLAPDAEEASLLDGFEPERADRRWPRTLAVAGGAVALVAALYVGSSYALADRVPRGATVAGVEIGSMSSDEAEQHLADELADRTGSPVPVVAQEVQAELDPVAAGLELDATATVARLTGVDLTQPVRLWRHVAGVGEQPPVTVVDEDALDAALTQLSGSLTLAPVDGTVVFADGAAHATEAVDGWELDAAGAATVLEEGWLTRARPVVLPTDVLRPTVSQEETDRALSQLAQPLAAAPVTVQVADRQAVLDVATLTSHAAVVPEEGILRLQLDGAALSEAVLAQVPDLLTVAADARFEFQDGAPVIVPGTPGTTLDPAALATSVVQAATAGTDRVAPVELVESDPAETTAALEALGVKEVVSEFSTPLTSEPRRTGNIANGLRNITGTLVRPGETFSLTEALGPVDAAHGYVQAGAIVNGEHKDAWGGGLSQVSTTTYNAAYFAGFEDVEHTPHSEWFQRYPEGREATIFTGVLDLKWKNNTPYGALVQGFVADGRAHVRIWGTKHFTVETAKSGRSGVVNPTTVYSQSPTCEPQSAGNPGFTVTNTRKVFLNGEEVDSESHTWRYKPQNRVICGTAPTPGAPPAP